MNDELKAGLLDGLRVVELAGDAVSFGGKLLADYGAEVIVVEPTGGHPTRWNEPFVDDVPDPEKSLYWWHFNTSKLGVTINLDTEFDRFEQLVATADIVLEGERPDRWASLAKTPDEFVAADPKLIWVSVTSFGRTDPRSLEPAVDLTLLAEGGPVWSCGYDDHDLPPVRPGGGHAYSTAGLWAVESSLAAVLNRDMTGLGQLIDISIFAALDVSTEGGSFWWLVAGETVQRQTARVAASTPTMSTLVTSADNRPVLTGVPPRTPKQMRQLLAWMRDCDLYDKFADIALLEMGAELEDISWNSIGDDVLVTEILSTAREALYFLGSHLTAYEFFVTGQEHGMAVGMVYAPEEVIEDRHLQDRGFPTTIRQPQLDRDVVYPGAPFQSHDAPWRISRPAPRLGEHNDLLDKLE